MAATMVSTHALPVTAAAAQASKRNGSLGASQNTRIHLRQMRKGTKSCRECRRRKVKCNYPSSLEPDSESAQSTRPEMLESTSSIASTTKCIECATHNRVCEIQGIVDNLSHNTNADEALSTPPRRIYKRRRFKSGVHNPQSDSPESNNEDREIEERLAPRPRLLKIHVNRMDSVAERLAESSRARERRSVNPEISLMDSYERIGAYDYVAAMNGVLHNYESHEQTDRGRGPLETSIHTIGSQAPLQSAFEQEMSVKTTSPVLSQVFNNSMISQTSVDPDTLSSKFQILTFSDLASTTDGDKLTSTIASEPYIMEVLDVSTHWWISWRDQAFALHEVFLNTEYLSAHANTALALDSNVAGGSKRRPIPISLQDFVRSKLVQKDNAIAIATGLLGIAMALQVLRPGIDDTRLRLSCPPMQLMDRILLVVDSVFLSPSSNPSYMNDPSILLLLMARCKIYAESNQIHKSFLILRTAINAAKNMGFADPHKRLRPNQTFSGIPNAGEGATTSVVSTETGEDVTHLVVRQRFLGSILELDRLMSMVLGFPYYEDDNFTDQLALAVLRDEADLQPDENGPDPPNVDLKMRALRRVVAIIAGRVNDRNVLASSGLDDPTLHTETMKLQASLSDAAAAMPDGWWDVETHLQAIPTDPLFVQEHLTAQLWYWETQALLHLFFMLKPSPYEHTRAGIDIYQENRILCFQGCRGMLRIFNLMRSNPSLAVYICNCDDFQGVLTGCILLVGLLMRKVMCPGEHARSVNAWPRQGEINESLALIEETKDIFRYRSQRQGGFISKQGLKVLIELGTFFDDHLDTADGRVGPRRRVVIMPYFGTINLEFGSSAQLMPLSMEPTASFDQEIDAMPPAAADAMKTLPLTPPVSSTGYSEEGGVVAAAAAMESIPGHEAIDLPDYSEELGVWPLPSTAAWIGGQKATDDYGNPSISDDMQFGFDIPSVNLDWDQFLFGDELGQDWNVELPEWYTMTDVTM